SPTSSPRRSATCTHPRSSSSGSSSFSSPPLSSRSRSCCSFSSRAAKALTPERPAMSPVSASNPRYRRRRRMNRVMMGVSTAALAFGLIWLVWIVAVLLHEGGAALLRASLFTQMTPPPGGDGGLANAIYGSVLMAGAGTLIGTPVGILAGTYLAEYGARGWLAPATRFINDVLLSAPSIVIGLFVYAVYVSRVGHFSGWAGALALAIIVIPVVVRTTDDMLKLVPATLRETAAALGCPAWRMVMSVTYRAARAGMVTGVLLAFARISGETAPLLFTALNNQFWSLDMNAPLANIPVT